MNWKMNNEIQKNNCLSISPDLVPVTNVWELLNIKLKQTFQTYQHGWKSLLPELAMKLVHSMNKRISEIAESNGDLIVR
jgi:hypothetical protein